MKKILDLIHSETPLQIVGVINAYSAMQAEQAGFQCLYISGAGVANASFGLPDLGLTSLTDVEADVRRVCAATRLPVLVDADTGWGGALNAAHTVDVLIRAGAAGMHIEDQMQTKKRCGHRPDKQLVSQSEMCEKLQAANDARANKDFMLMARTDALSVEGMEGAITRANSYIEAGADCIFAEAMTSEHDIQHFIQHINAPVLINMTEFGQTPLMSKSKLGSLGVSMILYPLSAFRAMSAAAESVFTEIRTHGSQKSLLDAMQTREQLYQTLEYYEQEQQQNKE